MFSLVSEAYRRAIGVIPLDCTVLVAGYRHDDIRATFAFLDRLERNVRLGPMYFVANSAEAVEAFHAFGRGTLIRGSNSDGEWSAYQEAMDAAHANGQLGKGALILNDTVITHRDFSILRFVSWLQRLRRIDPAGLIGDVDRLKGMDFVIQDYPATNWVSSYLMYLGPDLLDGLNHTVRVGKDLVDDWYKQASVERFFPDWLNEDLRVHLQHWMFGGGWYGSQPLTDANLAKFRFKAKAIFYEKALSGASAMHGHLVPVMRRKTLIQRSDIVLSKLRKTRMGGLLAPLFLHRGQG